MVESSCFGCEERKLGCHTTCEKYKEFQAKRKEIYLAKLEVKKHNTVTTSLQKSMIKKIKGKSK